MFPTLETHSSAPPLLLLHGFTGSSANWQPFFDAWGAHLRLIAVDLPGHGRAPAPADPAQYTMQHVAAGLLALLDARGIERTHLLGYSMGGRLALYLASHHPDRIGKLVLESSSPGLATTVARQERIASDGELANFIEREGIAAFVARWEALALWNSQQQLSPAVRQSLHEQRLRNSATGLANSLRGMGTGRQPSLWPLLPDLSLPALLIAGALDTKFVAINREMTALLPDARLEIVAGAGHAVHLERPDIFSRCVLDFLREE